MTLRRQPFSPITLISFRHSKNIRDNLVRSSLRQNLPPPAGTFSCSRARCYTCSFLNSATSISGSKSHFVIRTILHAPPPTSFTAFLAVNVVNFTSVKRVDVYLVRFAEHFCSVRNNDVNQPVAQHFNTANHILFRIKKCVPSHFTHEFRQR